MRSKDILHQAKKGIMLVKQAGGGWSSKVVAQQRPRVSKLGFKGLSDYHSNETVVEAARQGASEPNKKGYAHGISTQKERAGQQL
jgi:hypothetical protein